MQITRWIFREESGADVDAIAAQTGLPAVAVRVLCARGADTPEKIAQYLRDHVEMEDPFALIDMDRAVERIHQGIANGERICIFGDYDADGVTATTVLYSYLDGVGADVMYYIPTRDEDGYGLNNHAIDTISEHGATLLITVDCGISGVDEVAYAKTLGIDTVVTDHHQPGEILPDCCAVVDPCRADCPSVFKHLAGVGVAFKLVCALDGSHPDELLEEFGPFVAIGTVADVMPIVDENRYIVKRGLEVIKRGENLGLAALIENSVSPGTEVTAQTLAFTIAPRINAAGRMGSAEIALQLFLSFDPDDAADFVKELCERNTERQAVQTAIFEEIRQMETTHPELFNQRVIVLCGDDWNKGVVGIVSSRIVERFQKPCILMVSEDGEAKGSGRSFGDFNLFEALQDSSDLLLKYGGHCLAAGLSIEVDKIDAFRKRINDYARKNHPYMPLPERKVDTRAEFSELTLENIAALDRFGPFGHQNPKPLFLLEGAQVAGIYPVGGGKHLRVKLQKGTEAVFAMLFCTTMDELPYKQGDELDVIVSLDTFQYLGEPSLSVKIKDIHPAGIRGVEDIYTQFSIAQKLCLSEELTEAEFGEVNCTRAEIGLVYKAAMAFAGQVGSWLQFYAKICHKEITYCQMLLALRVLQELGILDIQRKSGENIHLGVNTGVRAELERSQVLHTLQEKRAVKLCI